MSAEDRAARRREQLLAAGLDTFGTEGFAATTVRSVCRAAGLTDRYFYAEHDRLEDLFIAVYEEATRQIEGAALVGVAEALESRDGDADLSEDIVVAARGGILAVLELVVGDPRLARIVWVEVHGISARVEAASLARLDRFGELLVTLLGEVVPGRELDGIDRVVFPRAAVGALTHVILKIIDEPPTEPLEDFADALARYITAVVR